MPSYELALALRNMTKPELTSTLKRVAESIFDRGGILRKIENLGARPLPYKTSAHGVVHRDAAFFVFKVDTTTKVVDDLLEEYSRDVDIIRKRIYKVTPKINSQCTLEDEMQPPAYREEVKKMMEMGKQQRNPFTYKFKYNSGLDYYPFNK